MIALFATCFFVGFAVAAITTLLLGKERSKMLPGGSLGGAVYIGVMQHIPLGDMILCGLVGIVGWLFLHLILSLVEFILSLVE